MHYKKFYFFVFVMMLIEVHSQNLDPLRTNDYHLQNKWVDSILNSMTLDQKIGQLFMVQAYSNQDEVHEKKKLKK